MRLKSLNLISFIEDNPAWSNIYGLSRSILATGTLLTFLTNKMNVLFIETSLRDGYCDMLNISLFCILDNLVVGKAISIIILLGVISGWRPMITGIFHTWVMYSFANSATILDGGDHIGLILSMLLLPVTLTDTRKWHWAKISAEIQKNTLYGIRNLIALSSLFAIKIQVSIIYLNSAAAKLKVEEWIDGTAIYYWFNHPVFGSPKWLDFIIEPILLNGTTLFILSWGTILFEFLLFAGIVMDRKFKKYFLISGVLFHFGIFIIHGLASFFFTMASCLIIYFTPISYQFKPRKISTLKDKIYDLFSYRRSASRSPHVDS